MSNLFWGETSSRDQSEGLQGSQTSLSFILILHGYRRPIDIQETRGLQKLERWYSSHFIHFMMNCYFYLLKWYTFFICFSLLFFFVLFCFFQVSIDFFWEFTTNYCKLAPFIIDHTLFIPNMDNPDYLVPLFCTSQLFL